MKLTGFDVETFGTLPEYALQPARRKTLDFWLTCAAFVYEDSPHTTTPINKCGAQSRRHPSVAWLREHLTYCAEQGHYVVGWNLPFDCACLIALGLRDEVYACKWLDGMLLYKHTWNPPTFERTTEANVRYDLKSAVAKHIPQWANYNDAVTFDPQTPEEWQDLEEYNIRDIDFSLRLTRRFIADIPPQTLDVALVESACIPMVADTMVHGVRIDRDACTELGDELLKAISLSFSRLRLSGVQITLEDMASPTKLRNIIHKEWGLPIVKLTKKGVASTDREALQIIGLKDERAGLVSDNREATANKAKFADAVLESLDYNGDGVVRPGFRIFGTYCVPGDVEVLTREGWKALHNWCGGDIAQYHPDGAVEFLPAGRFVGPVVDRWVRVSTKQLDCDFTHGHTVPYLQQRSYKLCTLKAEELLTRTGNYVVPHGGLLRDTTRTLSADQLRLLVAIQADGYFSARGGVKFTLKKQRKIDRLHQLLSALKITYRDYMCTAYPDRTEIHITKSNLPAWIDHTCKRLGAWTLLGGDAGVCAVAEELQYWDGSKRQDGGFVYSSAVEKDVEWAVTVCSLAGRKARAHKPYRGMYACHVGGAPDRSVIRCRKHVSEVHTIERCYCATTETGFWLARSRGKIFVTGNTGRGTYSSKQGRGKSERPVGIALHQWKRDPAYRKLILPPEGYTLLEFDFAGQEFRWMAVCSNDTTMLGLCAPGEDAHGYMGAQIAQEDYRTLVAAVASGDKEAKRYRQLGKVGNLSCFSNKNCVLTDRGYVPIRDVRLTDMLWDGVEWVHHAGVVYQGHKKVIQYDGIEATEDHKVLVKGAWVTLAQARVREDKADRAAAIRLDASEECTARAVYPRNPCRVQYTEAGERHAPTVHQPERQGVSQLRRTGDRVSVPLRGARVPLHPHNPTTFDIQGHGHRQDRQRWPLRAGELAACEPQSQPAERTPRDTHGEGLAVGQERGKPLRMEHDLPASARGPDTLADTCSCPTCSAREAQGLAHDSEELVPVYDIINAGPRHRFVVNGRIVSNCQYRTSAETLMRVAAVQHKIELTFPQSKDIWVRYRKTYPSVLDYWKRQVEKVRQLTYVENLAGRRVHVAYPGDRDSNLRWSYESTAINFPIQSMGADQKYLALKVALDYLPKVNGRFYYELHDGLFFVVPTDKADVAVRDMKKLLSNLPYKQAFNLTLPVEFPVDAKMGPSWGDLKEWKDG